MENHQNLNQEEDLESWGTWEELLLACAVNRHGFKDWDAVAMEVQSRTNKPNLVATATHCEQRFHDLNRRFADQCNNRLPPPRQNGAAVVNSDHVPWLEKLRKLRVAELRRDVQRSDVSIMSLQLQVKTLEEEKAKENDAKDEKKPDLTVSAEHNRSENDKTGRELGEPEPANSEPETRRLDESTTNTDKLLPTTGDESDRENQSVNESNSTGSRFEAAKTGAGEVNLMPGPGEDQTSPKEPDPVLRKKKPVGEESNNGSYDNEAKVPTCESVPPSEERKVGGDSSELHDSVTQSGEVGTRESGEVESSASLTRKRMTRRRKEVSGGGDVLPEKRGRVLTKSEPLVGVLEMIKGHENISFFERRLESQDSDRYKDIVKQHVDLETIQLRLQKGHYSSCTNAFFRDLLLLFINATVFFPHDSAESRAAQQLHRLIVSEMKSHGQTQSDTTPQKTDSLPPNTPLPKPDSLLSKHKASAPILVCRKRSSISVKPSSATIGQKVDQQPTIDKKEKPSSDSKQPMKPYYTETDEEEPPSPKTKEKPVTGARSMRRSNKSLNSNKKLPSNSTPKSGSTANKPVDTPKLDKKRIAAADFLKRIKRNGSSEVVRSGGGGGSSSSSRGGGGSASVKDQKKTVGSGKGDKGKERASRHNEGGGSVSGDKRSKNVENSQSKRSVGRPPKKTAAETSAKRGRESSASAGKDKRPKKRSKK